MGNASEGIERTRQHRRLQGILGVPCDAIAKVGLALIQKDAHQAQTSARRQDRKISGLINRSEILTTGLEAEET
ncbi:MAG: hypothetical protein ABIR57_09175 [Aeromicrobium sp.]